MRSVALKALAVGKVRSVAFLVGLAVFALAAPWPSETAWAQTITLIINSRTQGGQPLMAPVQLIIRRPGAASDEILNIQAAGYTLTLPSGTAIQLQALPLPGLAFGAWVRQVRNQDPIYHSNFGWRPVASDTRNPITYSVVPCWGENPCAGNPNELSIVAEYGPLITLIINARRLPGSPPNPELVPLRIVIRTPQNACPAPMGECPGDQIIPFYLFRLDGRMPYTRQLPANTAVQIQALSVVGRTFVAFERQDHQGRLVSSDRDNPITYSVLPCWGAQPCQAPNGPLTVTAVYR